MINAEQLKAGAKGARAARNSSRGARRGRSVGWGVDSDAFIRILAKNSPAQNKAVREAYENRCPNGAEGASAVLSLETDALDARRGRSTSPGTTSPWNH